MSSYLSIFIWNLIIVLKPWDYCRKCIGEIAITLEMLLFHGSDLHRYVFCQKWSEDGYLSLIVAPRRQLFTWLVFQVYPSLDKRLQHLTNDSNVEKRRYFVNWSIYMECASGTWDETECRKTSRPLCIYFVHFICLTYLWQGMHLNII